MPVSLSTEGRIESILRALNCSGRAFENIAAAKRVKVPHTAFVLAMDPNSKKSKSLDHLLGSRLLEVACLMRDTQRYFADVPIDWSQSERVAMLLSLMMMKQVASEQGLSDLAETAEHVLNEEKEN